MRKVVLCLAAVLLLTGCGTGLPQGREMDDTALMRTMGVDVGTAPGEWTVTASTARRAKGLQSEGQPPLILSAQRPSLAGACLTMQELSDSYVFYGHVDQLLLGEEMARRGDVQEVLEYFGREAQLGLGTQVWLVRGESAQTAVRAGEEKGVSDRLTSLREDEEMGMAAVTRTAGEVLTDLLENGSAYLPVLTLDGQETETALLENGYGVLKGDALVGWLTGEAARGLELLQRHPGAQLLELGDVSVQVNTSTLTCVPVMEKGELTGLELDLRLSGRVAERRGDARSQEGVEEAVQRRLEEQAGRTLAHLQQWNADCLSLKRLAGLAQPAWWDALCRQWEARFPTLKIQVRCTAAVTDLEG